MDDPDFIPNHLVSSQMVVLFMELTVDVDLTTITVVGQGCSLDNKD